MLIFGTLELAIVGCALPVLLLVQLGEYWGARPARRRDGVAGLAAAASNA